MTDLVFDDPCVVFALGREAQAFCREFRPQQRFPGAPCRARFCGPEWLTVLALETGVGSSLASHAMEWILNRPVMGKVPYRPKVVISAGFAGSLAEEMKLGDVILATEVTDSEGNTWPTTWPGELPAGEWRPVLHRGRVFCSSAIIGSPRDKRALGGQHVALAVDMESATIARHCHKHDIPFGCVRVISDDVNTSLSPSLISLLRDGRVSPLRILLALLTAPTLAGEMWCLAKNTRLAGQQLHKALGELLTLTLPWGRDL